MMVNKAKHKAALPNPLLQPFQGLIGEWKTEGRHPYFPGKIFHGHSVFSWLEDGAFLLWKTETEEIEIPDGLAIMGIDDSAAGLYMLYFDERKVSRKYEVSFKENIWKFWRNDSRFSQRFTFSLSENNMKMSGKGEMKKDGSAWEEDLKLSYSRIN